MLRLPTHSRMAVTLLSRQELFMSPFGSTGQLSPDGSALAFVKRAPQSPEAIWLQSFGASAPEKYCNSCNAHDIRWTSDGRSILFTQDPDGHEREGLFVVDEQRGIRELTPVPGTTCTIVSDTDYLDSSRILVSTTSARGQRNDVYAVNIFDGTSSLDTTDQWGGAKWFADRQKVIRGAVVPNKLGGFTLHTRATGASAWDICREWRADEEGRPLRFSEDGGTLFLLCNHGSNEVQLRALSTTTGLEELIFAPAKYDVLEVTFDPLSGVPQAVLVDEGRPSWYAVGQQLAADLDALRSLTRGGFRIVNRAQYDQLWLLRITSDREPSWLALYDRSSSKLRRVGERVATAIRKASRPMEHQVIDARDGLKLGMYVTLPRGRETGASVLNIHGGPWAHDTWGFDPTVQWLANRGYAVVQVNFRGSTGQGKDFLSAGYRQWGLKIHDDLVDVATWLVRAGVADSSKIGVLGASFGGYASLTALCRSPDLFAAGVSMFGVTDLKGYLQAIPPQWEVYRNLLYHRIGRPEDDFLVSPLALSDSIRAPVFLAHGANDPRISRSHSDRLAEKLRANSQAVEYIVFDNEGHGIRRIDNRLLLLGRIEAFLARYLGGAMEPMPLTVGILAS